jgi:hypothetical protein
MPLLRSGFFEFLICIHVIGAAVLFRRLFPRESPWFGFFIPILAVMSALNFLEHFVALPVLGWLLPFTLGGAIWVMVQPGYSWKGLKLPTVLFVVIFTFSMALRCISPDIPNWTEGAGDMTRVLEYCLGSKLPAIDCWMPPYDRGGYYTFQHYGASILKRLFVVDIGTGYNLAFGLLAAVTALIGAGAAHSIGGKRAWVSVATALVVLAGSTGSAIFLIFLSKHEADYGTSLVLNVGWDDPNGDRNPFWWLSSHDRYHPGLKLLPPMYTLYYSEYHANLGGVFMVVASLLGASEVLQRERSDWPWICLVVLPMMTIIMCAWFFFVVLFICAGSLAIALIASRRPQNWRLVALISCVSLVLVWPSVSSLIMSASPLRAMEWTQPEFRTPFWMFLVQWWPVYVPWLLLCFVWRRLDLTARWLHAAVAILYIALEFITIGDRPLEIEKMWGAIYTVGLVTVVPLVFAQRGLIFRFLTVIMMVVMMICMAWWLKVDYGNVDWPCFCRLQGDHYIRVDPQRNRLMQVMERLHGVTILPGKTVWAYNQAPAAIDFTENRCWIAWPFQETECGHPDEPGYRSKLNNAFYAGTMTDPLSFLRGNDIAAVLIWPEDKISDALLEQLKSQIGSEYCYIDCRLQGDGNAGLFVRQPLSQAALSPSMISSSASLFPSPPAPPPGVEVRSHSMK